MNKFWYVEICISITRKLNTSVMPLLEDRYSRNTLQGFSTNYNPSVMRDQHLGILTDEAPSFTFEEPY